MSKRRFGVSLPADIADDLDELARLVGSDRSSIVAEALKQFIHDHLHYMVRHKCMGIIVSVKSRESYSKSSLIDEFENIVKNYIHYHMEGLCIEIFFVMGDSEEIVKLHNKLRKITPHVRYIPLSTMVEKH